MMRFHVFCVWSDASRIPVGVAGHSKRKYGRNDALVMLLTTLLTPDKKE